MKLYTVIDIPDVDYKMSDHWVIDIDGDTRYLDEDGALITYKSSQYELRPLPEEKDTSKCFGLSKIEEAVGYNDCLKEIIGGR